MPQQGEWSALSSWAFYDEGLLHARRLYFVFFATA
jgi:hypothetical protein